MGTLMRGCLLLAIAFLFGPLVALIPATAQTPNAAEPSPAEIREAIDAVYDGRNYQRELPRPDGDSLANRRESDLDGKEGETRDKPQGWQPLLWRLPGEWSEVLRIVIWVVGGVGLLLLLYFLVMELPALRRARAVALVDDKVGDSTGLRRAEARLEDPASLEEADRLARAGRFAEAIHVLLLHAIEVLRARLESGLSQALTGREVLRLAPMPDAAAAALQALVRRSEHCHFGGRAADRDLYQQSLDHFQAFRDAWRRSPERVSGS